MKKVSTKLLVFLLIAVFALSIFTFVACDRDNGGDEKIVRISTTTSVNDSGLMGYLQPYFEADTGYKWEISSAGTGAAINAAKYGNADVILVHSKKSETEFIDGDFARTVNGALGSSQNTVVTGTTDGYPERISFMYNFFVLVGPTADGAGAGNAESVKAAFEAISSSKSLFVSRGDKSGTHNKEWTLWPSSVGLVDNDVSKIPAEIKLTDNNPDGWYISAGQGMGACLTMANEKGAYCLTDKATFLSYKNSADGDKLPNLSILYEEDSDLKNTYSMIAVDKNAPFIDSVSGERLPEGTVKIDETAANVFVLWMLGDHAQQLIRDYGIEQYGGSLFTLMPSGYTKA